MEKKNNKQAAAEHRTISAPTPEDLGISPDEIIDTERVVDKMPDPDTNLTTNQLLYRAIETLRETNRDLLNSNHELTKAITGYLKSQTVPDIPGGSGNGGDIGEIIKAAIPEILLSLRK